MKTISIRENDAALVPIIERLIASGERDAAWIKTTYLKSAVKRRFFYARIKEMPAPTKRDEGRDERNN